MTIKPLNVIRSWADGVFSLFVPRLCVVCGAKLIDGEKYMCLGCMAEMPQTNIHRTRPNRIHELLMPVRKPVDKAASLFYYNRNDPYSNLIREAKYYGRPDIYTHLARGFASVLKADGFFDGMDVILPVPVHFTRRIMRGYNQTEYLARGLAEVSGLPVGDNLVAVRPHTSQTRRKGEQRRMNVARCYGVSRPGELDSLHILVVDDVITTGATLASVIELLHSALPSCRTSVLSLALTSS